MNEERTLLSFGAHVKSLRLKKDISQEQSSFSGLFVIGTKIAAPGILSNTLAK